MLYEIVNDLKKQLHVTDYDYPLNIFKMCSKISNVEIAAVPFNTRDLRGMVSLAKNDNENNVILVNSSKSFEEQNFHGFHELMHIPTVDEPGTILRCYECVKPNQDSYLEWLANEGAAEFTVPYKMLLPIIKYKYSDLTQGLGTFDFCVEYSAKFRVSTTVMQYRIETLKYEIEQYLNGTPLDDIEILSRRKQDERGIVVHSLVEMENQRLSVIWNKTHNKKQSTNASSAEFLTV